MIVLALLGPAAVALADSRDVLADAQDNGRVDACYSRSEFRDALRLARADQRLYSATVDNIGEAQISNVKVAGQPCGSGRRVPHEAIPDDSGAGAGLWIGLLAAVGVVAVGAGAWAHRAGGDGG
jgi:hypothetical protein